MNILHVAFHKKKIFLDRFALYMLIHSQSYLMPHGRPVLDYVREVGPYYWIEGQRYNLSPEKLAANDMSFWPSDFGVAQQTG